MDKKITFYSHGKDKPSLIERVRGIKEPAQIVRGQAFPRNIQDLREGKHGLFAEVIGREETVEAARLRVQELLQEGDLSYNPNSNGEVTGGIFILGKTKYKSVSEINDWVEQILASGRAQTTHEALEIITVEWDEAIKKAREGIDQTMREHMPLFGIFSPPKKSA